MKNIATSGLGGSAQQAGRSKTIGKNTGRTTMEMTPEIHGKPNQSIDVVELDGERAMTEWQDALEKQEFADSVIFAIDCLVKDRKI